MLPSRPCFFPFWFLFNLNADQRKRSIRALPDFQDWRELGERDQSNEAEVKEREKSVLALVRREGVYNHCIRYKALI